MDLKELLDQTDSLTRIGLIVERIAGPDDTRGTVRANVEHVVCHSPAGFECGYAGSGPADLALSVLAALIPAPPVAQQRALQRLKGDAWARAQDDDTLWSEPVGRNRKHVSRLAWALHQDFKRDFIAPMDEAGGFVPIETIREWIAKAQAARSERLNAALG